MCSGRHPEATDTSCARRRWRLPLNNTGACPRPPALYNHTSNAEPNTSRRNVLRSSTTASGGGGNTFACCSSWCMGAIEYMQGPAGLCSPASGSADLVVFAPGLQWRARGSAWLSRPAEPGLCGSPPSSSPGCLGLGLLLAPAREQHHQDAGGLGLLHQALLLQQPGILQAPGFVAGVHVDCSLQRALHGQADAEAAALQPSAAVTAAVPAAPPSPPEAGQARCGEPNTPRAADVEASRVQQCSCPHAAPELRHQQAAAAGRGTVGSPWRSAPHPYGLPPRWRPGGSRGRTTAAGPTHTIPIAVPQQQPAAASATTDDELDGEWESWACARGFATTPNWLDSETMKRGAAQCSASAATSGDATVLSGRCTAAAPPAPQPPVLEALPPAHSMTDDEMDEECEAWEAERRERAGAAAAPARTAASPCSSLSPALPTPAAQQQHGAAFDCSVIPAAAPSDPAFAIAAAACAAAAAPGGQCGARSSSSPPAPACDEPRPQVQTQSQLCGHEEDSDDADCGCSDGRAGWSRSSSSLACDGEEGVDSPSSGRVDLDLEPLFCMDEDGGADAAQGACGDGGMALGPLCNSRREQQQERSQASADDGALLWPGLSVATSRRGAACPASDTQHHSSPIAIPAHGARPSGRPAAGLAKTPTQHQQTGAGQWDAFAFGSPSSPDVCMGSSPSGGGLMSASYLRALPASVVAAVDRLLVCTVMGSALFGDDDCGDGILE